MKAILAGDPGIYTEEDYRQFIYNCKRNKCQMRYSVPLPHINNAELYVFFGSLKPAAIQIQFISTCEDHNADIIAQDYVVGELPNGQWYGVFKNFTAPADYDPKCFVISMIVTFIDDSQLRYYSEEYCISTCDPLMEVRACYPDGQTVLGFDINDIYFGFTTGLPDDALGNSAIRYYHRLYVRNGQVLNTAHRTQFKLNTISSKNFRTEVTKLWEFRCELLPEFYKDYLFALMVRGVIAARLLPDVVFKTYTLSETNFELLDDDAQLWRAVATMISVAKQYFGCDASICVPPCIGAPGGANMTGPVDGIWTFDFVGGTIGTGESIAWEVLNAGDDSVVLAGEITALPLQFTIGTADGFNADENCYKLRFRKICAADESGSFSLDFDEGFETGAGAPNATPWQVQSGFGNCDGGGGGGDLIDLLITTNDALGDVCTPSPSVFVKSDTPHIGPGTHLYNFITGLPLSGLLSITQVKEVGFIEIYAFDNAGLVGAHIGDC